VEKTTMLTGDADWRHHSQACTQLCSCSHRQYTQPGEIPGEATRRENRKKQNFFPHPSHLYCWTVFCSTKTTILKLPRPKAF